MLENIYLWENKKGMLYQSVFWGRYGYPRLCQKRHLSTLILCSLALKPDWIRIAWKISFDRPPSPNRGDIRGSLPKMMSSVVTEGASPLPELYPIPHMCFALFALIWRNVLMVVIWDSCCCCCGALGPMSCPGWGWYQWNNAWWLHAARATAYTLIFRG